MKYILILLLLSGCASQSVKPIQVQRIEIPIAMPCITPTPQQPAFNIPQLKQSDDIFVKTKSILADIELHVAYETELLAALLSCK